MVKDLKPKTIFAGVAIAVISALIVDFVKTHKSKKKTVSNTDEPAFKNWTGDNQFFETDGDTYLKDNLHLKMIPVKRNDLPYTPTERKIPNLIAPKKVKFVQA